MRTKFDNSQAFDEGWGLFDIDSSDTQRIQFLADPPSGKPSPFRTDDDAVKHVMDMVELGSQYHAEALRIHSMPATPTTDKPMNLTPKFGPADFAGYGNSWLMGESITIHGTPFHVEAIQCVVVDGETRVVHPFENAHAAEFDAYILLNNTAPELTKIPGFDGEYLILIYPYGV